MLNQLNFILQSQPTNKKFPFIDKCLKLKRNQKYGRYIVTKKSCKFGDIVGIEKPSCFIRFGVNSKIL